MALQDDRLYDAFNQALRDAFVERHGFDPDEDEEDELEQED